MFSPLDLASLQEGQTIPEGMLTSAEAPIQWWKKLGAGYSNYIATLKALGANPGQLPPRRPQQAAPMPYDPRSMPGSPNVITYGGRR